MTPLAVCELREPQMWFYGGCAPVVNAVGKKILRQSRAGESAQVCLGTRLRSFHSAAVCPIYRRLDKLLEI
jgi:hypothetical protein